MEKMELPKEWVSIGYNELFTQVSTTNKKIKTKDMLDTGKYPVIDQSESFISGFYNDETKLVYIHSLLLFLAIIRVALSGLISTLYQGQMEFKFYCLTSPWNRGICFMHLKL